MGRENGKDPLRKVRHRCISFIPGVRREKVELGDPPGKQKKTQRLCRNFKAVSTRSSDALN